MRSLYEILPSRTIQTCLSLWERCRAATERACIDYVLSPVCLMRTGQCPALSVICFANASSPKGRAEKSVRTDGSHVQSELCTATERACISYVLSPVCLMRTSQRPALSVICFANASSPKGRAEKSVRTDGSHVQSELCTATERACISYVLSPVCLMRTSQRPALSVICFANASSPKGRAEKSVRTDGSHRLVFTQRAVLPHGRA